MAKSESQLLPAVPRPGGEGSDPALTCPEAPWRKPQNDNPRPP